jgi:plasmid stabilization system protein ParE
MILKYHPEAANEVHEAFEWYESQKNGLGSQFISDLEVSLRRLQNFPHSSAIISKGYRRAILPIFPYGIFYKVKDEAIEIYSISHLHRKPKHWIKRKFG